jgi:uncharacterized protein YutE (UPF0331/DUF86 family)
MPQSRKLRYYDKIHHIEIRLGNINDWIEDFNQSEMHKLATFKAIQEVIEGLTDLISMVLKDKNIPPRDDYSNFEKMVDAKIITKEQQLVLNEANGLRNRLVHTYNGIDASLAVDSYQMINQSITEILEVIREWIEKFFNK